MGPESVFCDRPIRPAPELREWAVNTFIDPDGPLANEDHIHLVDADIGFLWAAAPNTRQMNSVVGEAEMPTFRCGKWQKARQEQQIAEWFGSVPDFLITIFAPYAAACDDASFCALIEHELFHCGQERDEFGAPKFKMSGEPAFALRSHDVEEFVGVVARYGIGAAAGRTADLVRAANKGPQIAESLIHGACGTCGRKVA